VYDVRQKVTLEHHRGYMKKMTGVVITGDGAKYSDARPLNLAAWRV